MLFHNHIEELDLTAADARRHLLKLQAERALAVDTGVAEVASYMADLDDEIEATRIIYTWSAVTEIATLRAEMTGPQVG
jgi:ATP phosphoribosyltransferase regulatory subunit HisZ